MPHRKMLPLDRSPQPINTDCRNRVNRPFFCRPFFWARLRADPAPGRFAASAFPVPLSRRRPLRAAHSPRATQVNSRVRRLWCFSFCLIQRQLDAQYPDNPKGYTVLASSVQADNTRTVRASLFTLIATVGLVLLMACTNLSNLLVSRAIGRQREMVIRAALGSGRAPLIRQLLTESGLLALLGSSLGVFVAYAALRTFVARNPLGVLPPNPISINLPVLL